jgi:hypothetical protein
MEIPMTTLPLSKTICAALGLSALAFAAQAQTDVSVSVGGIIKPGVYGRVEVGTRPPPPVIYPQPVIITQPVIVAQPAVVVAPPQPLYMHVPPGHAKKWNKHCYKYNACNQPVYFVQNDYREYYKEHGKGHGKGKHKGKHDHDD